MVSAALAAVAEVDPARLARHAGHSFLDFGSCVAGGRSAGGAPFADDPARLALEAHALDRDDLHPATLVHPGGIVWPATIVAARGRGTAGTDAVMAAAVGYEVTIAIARLLGSEARRFWHPTALAGTVGAAAAAAWVYSGRERLVHAVGHAISVAGGSVVALLERSETGLVHRAHAAATGVLCAQAACAGLDATRFGIESPRGFLGALRSDAGVAGAPPGDAPAIAQTAQRRYAASGFAQAAIDAARTLGPLEAAGISRVSIGVSPAGAALAGSVDPADDAEAWWSIPHAVSVALTAADPDELEAGLARDPEVIDLVSRCSVEGRRDDLGASIKVDLVSGRQLHSEAEWATGDPRRPLTDAQRIAKWELLAGTDGEAALRRALVIGDVPFEQTVEHILGQR